ncbi:MAG: shikimate kinase [Salinibacterium sp.]|nr:MAG: shikimate kinase [Salinibacterium sp.]
MLIGAPGAGKTRTGKRVARLLNVPLIDTDKRIVAEHGPIANIFATQGAEHFRALERDAVARALTEHAVVTLGGGAVLNPDTQADLAGKRVVQLTVSPESVALRILGGKRPLLKDGVAAWSKLVAERQPIYDRLSQLTLDTSHQSLDGIAKQIVNWLQAS